MNVDSQLKVRSRWFGSVAVGTVCVLTGFSVNAQGPATDDASAWIWTSRNSSMDQLAAEVTELYENLINENSLPTQSYKDPSGQMLETVFRTSGQFYGAYFNEDMQEIACKLNQEYCQIKLDLESPDQKALNWTNQAGDNLIIPAVGFTKALRWVPHQKSSGEDIRDIIVNLYGGCDSIDEECRNLLREMNRDGLSILEENYEGPVWLPQLQLRTTLDIGDQPVLQKRLQHNIVPAAKFEEYPKQTSTDRQLLEFNRDIRTSYAALERDDYHYATATGTANHDLAETEFVGSGRIGNSPAYDPRDLPSDHLEEYEEEEGGFARTEPELDASVGAEARLEFEPPDSEDLHFSPSGGDDVWRKLFLAQQAAFAQINLPKDEQLEGFIGNPLVSVVDTVLDAGHCGFDPANVFSFDQMGRLIVPDFQRDACGAPGPARTPDHGTHVAGLIAAIGHPANGELQFRGVNPAARLEGYFFPLESNVESADAAYLLEAASIIEKAARHFPQVLNVSFSYEPDGRGDADAVIAHLKQLESFTLVVVAAGNDGEVHNGVCPTYPSCARLSNILVVAALDSDSQLWRSPFGNATDYGVRVHLAAPGFSIPSTLRANRIGALEGTSQAAPLVSGAASLIYGKAGPKPPYVVRNRLIFSSDFLPHLNGKLLGGRLNVSRALEFEVPIVQLKPNSTVTCNGQEIQLQDPTVLKGQIRYLSNVDGEAKDFQFRVLPLEDDRTTLDLRTIGRMIRNPVNDDEYLILESVHTEKQINRFHAVLNSGSRLVNMSVDSSELAVSGSCKFAMRHIRDYLSPIEWK